MYSGEQLISMLSEQGVVFGRYSEGMTNIPATCPFHACSPGKTPFYTYVGPPIDGKMPGASFCHRCDEGWSLSGLMKKLGAPAAVVDAIQDYLRLINRPKRHRGTNGVKAEFDFVLPEALLGGWDFTPKKMLDWGFTEETIRHFDIGFDRAEKRITFPIRDHHGVLVGVSGRSARPWQTRYRVYKEEFHSLIRNYEMKKGMSLWGLHHFYETRMRSGTAQPPLIICEGFKAAMWVYQCGFPHVVASMGTHLSAAQTRLLTCISSSIIMFWDHDTAGREALAKKAKFLRRDGLDVRVANYATHDEVSPDDLDPKTVQRAIAESLTLRQWRHRYDAAIQ